MMIHTNSTLFGDIEQLKSYLIKRNLVNEFYPVIFHLIKRKVKHTN